GARQRWIPAMDLVETDEHFVLRADLPGLRQEDINLELEDRVLTISGERRAGHESREGDYHRIERAVGTFSRSLTLPQGIDADAVQADFDNGVLEVRIPKPQERKPRRLTIGIGDQPATIEGAGADR
ncbi:MAG: Hsp20/alpha crystallin family protein, partial [Solirubrobacterales bacterium]|nr:Hsp20/alpha crystallin family protein [Solirubrobacterales bacterium]